MAKKKELYTEQGVFAPEVTIGTEEGVKFSDDDVGNKLPTIEFNDEAFSIAKDKNTGRFHLVTIKYDFDTKTLGSLEVGTESNDEKLIMFDNMKIAIGKYLWR